MKRSRDEEQFASDFNDEFETSAQAIQDIEPVLYRLCVALQKKKSELVIYDPYYCQGTVRNHFECLGFSNFIHAKRDFYKDVEQNSVPSYDVLVTNPAYSSNHKERCLQFCLASKKPWLLLMPNYVATKDYYHQTISALDLSQRASTSTGHISSPFYIVPTSKYEYLHPTGAGKSSSPFFSIWYVYLCQEHTGKIYHWMDKKLSGGGAAAAKFGFSIVKSVQDLKEEGAAPSWKRPNPRQRKAAKKAKGQE
jgi:hypothetical protein